MVDINRHIEIVLEVLPLLTHVLTIGSSTPSAIKTDYHRGRTWDLRLFVFQCAFFSLVPGFYV